MRAGDFGREPVESLPWSDRRRLAGRAGPPLDPPELTVLSETPTANGRHLRLHVRSRRAARVLFLVVPMSAEPRAVRVEQEPLEPPARLGESAWRTIQVVAPPEDGVRIEMELGSREPVTIFVADASDGLPPELADVAAARDAVAAGDRTFGWREARLETW